MLAAKFSLPFAVATSIVHGGIGLDAFRDEARRNPAVQDLARRVTVREDPALTAMLPGLRPARLRVTLADGHVLSAEVLTNRGDTEDPYGPQDVTGKFFELAGPTFGTEGARRIADAVGALDRTDATTLLALLDAPALTAA
jgi:2-methylcitrate dehydratase PrpD